MECSASEIPCKALKKKRKATDTQMIPPPICMVFFIIIYTPLKMVRLDGPFKI